MFPSNLCIMNLKRPIARKLSLSSVFFLFLFGFQFCTPAEIKEIQEFSSNYSKLVSTLASDSFEGRAPSTPGGNKTEAFIEAEFRRIGLLPGNGDSFRQTVPLLEIEGTKFSDMVVKSENDTIALQYLDDMVVGSARLVDSVSLRESELVFAGYGIVAPEYDWNDYEGLDVIGKTVVVLVNDPGFATQDPDLFTGNAMTYYGRWTYKYEEAARQGASGILVIHETEPASYGWEVVRNSWSGPQYYMGGPRAVQPALVEGWIQYDIAVLLMEMAGLSLETVKDMALSKDFKPFSLDMNVSVEFKVRHVQSESDNIIGYVEGRERPDEYILYMAHWDHLGKVETDDGVDIYNGAIDNATGTAALMVIAEKFAGMEPAPERSVVFIALTAEESGLIGAKYYAEDPLFPLERTAGGINMDGLNVYGPTHDIEVIGYNASDIQMFLEREAEKQTREVNPEPYPERGYFYRSDHFPFVKKGVPMIYANSGNDFIGRDEDYAEKVKEDAQGRYHSPSDVITDMWDWKGLDQNLWLFYETGLELANDTYWPTWSETSEFRAIREISAGMREP